LLNDFAPIAGLEKTALIIVGTKTPPAKDLAELIAWIKSNPNKASAPGSKRSSILDSLRSSFTRNCEKDQYGHSAGYRHGPNCLSHPGLLHPARTSTL
jgi:hypothetical protein